MPKAQVKIHTGPRLLNGVPTLWVQVGQERNLRAIVMDENSLLHLLANTSQCLRDLYVNRFRSGRE